MSHIIRKPQNDVRLKRRQFRRALAHALGIARAPALLDAQIAADRPAQLLQRLPECGIAGRHLRIVCGETREHADAPHPLALLRARRERPRRRRAAEKRDEFAPSHSITSSARASSVGGKVRPRSFAILRLSTNSNLTGAWTGSSPGFSPLRMRST